MSASGKSSKHDSFSGRNRYPETTKRYDSPGRNRSQRNQDDTRRPRQPYREDRGSRNEREQQPYEPQDRSRDYQASSRVHPPYPAKKDIGQGGSARFHNEDKKYVPKEKDRERQKYRQQRERSRERNRSRSRSYRRRERSSSRSRSPSRRRYRSRSRPSRDPRSRDRSYDRRSKSRDSRHSNDSRRNKKSSGYDSYYKSGGRRQDTAKDMIPKEERRPSREKRQDIKKQHKEIKDHKQQREYRDAYDRDNGQRGYKEQRQFKDHKEAANTDARYPPVSKEKVNTDTRNPEKDRSRPWREHDEPSSFSSKPDRDNRQKRPQQKPTEPILESKGPFLAEESRPPIRIDLEHLSSHSPKPFHNLDESNRQSRKTTQTKMAVEDQWSSARTAAYPKREKQPNLPRHEAIKPPLPVKQINETQELIRAAKALTTFSLPDPTFLIVESFRRLDGYEFELEGLTPEWRSKLQDDKSNINLLRSQWLNSSNQASKIAMAVQKNPATGPMIPPRHLLLEKSQFVNPDYEQRLEQLAELIRSKARISCQASRKLVQTEVELQSLRARRLQA